MTVLRQQTDTLADAVIVGGGIVGLSCALALTARGRSVVVIDRDRPPERQASYGNAGVINPATPNQPQPGASSGPAAAISHMASIPPCTASERGRL